jgi:hypothetical protein
LNNINKIILIVSLFIFWGAFAQTKPTQLELFTTHLKVPVGYNLYDSKFKRTTTYHFKNGEEIISAFTFYKVPQKIDCPFLCESSQVNVSYREIDQKYELMKSYVCPNSRANLWQQTTMSGEEKEFIGVIFNQEQLLSIYGDKNTWQQWLNTLNCTESKLIKK